MKKTHLDLYTHDFTAKSMMANIATIMIDEDWAICQGWLT
jgi:hypothetical protein